MSSSEITPGPLGMADTRPMALAPCLIASQASGLNIQDEMDGAPCEGAALILMRAAAKSLTAGKVTLLWPWKIIDMWRWTKQADPADYQLR